MSDPIQSSTINGYKFAIPTAPWRTVKQKPHAAQIPCSFFPDGSHPNDRTPESNPSVLRSSQCPKEGHDSGTIIRDTRQEQCVRLAAKLQWHRLGKNGIQVSRHNHWISTDVLIANDNVSHRIRRGMEPRLL
jgi:hypothetical protein